MEYCDLTNVGSRYALDHIYDMDYTTTPIMRANAIREVVGPSVPEDMDELIRIVKAVDWSVWKSACGRKVEHAGYLVRLSDSYIAPIAWYGRTADVCIDEIPGALSIHYHPATGYLSNLPSWADLDAAGDHKALLVTALGVIIYWVNSEDDLDECESVLAARISGGLGYVLVRWAEL